MAEEPLDQFFTNLFIHSQIEQKQADDRELERLKAQLKANNNG